MINSFLWALPLLLNPPEAREASERLAPPGFQGNDWGPEVPPTFRPGSPLPANQDLPLVADTK